MDKNHKDPDVIDLSAPRHALYLHNAWRSQDAVFLVDINFAVKKGLTFCQKRSNAIILHERHSAPFRKVYMSPRPPPKISLKHEWKRELGSEHAQRSEVAKLSRSFQSNNHF